MKSIVIFWKDFITKQILKNNFKSLLRFILSSPYISLRQIVVALGKMRPMANTRAETGLPGIGVFVLCALAFLTVQTVPGVVAAESVSAAIPDNARAKNYGSGWECNEGYREKDGLCAVIEVPANAYPTKSSNGKGWKCSWGHREEDNACIAIEVPANAYLDGSGDIWTCDRGFRKVADACVAIQVPANGYLVDSSYGTGWACNRGFRAVGNDCVAVELPRNAHLDYTGQDWDCNRPYLRQYDICVLP